MDLDRLEWRLAPPSARKLYWRDENHNPYVYKVFAAVYSKESRYNEPAWIARTNRQGVAGTTDVISCESMEDGMRQAETYVALTNYDCFLKGRK
jgi:hypothetical protein